MAELGRVGGPGPTGAATWRESFVNRFLKFTCLLSYQHTGTQLIFHHDYFENVKFILILDTLYLFAIIVNSFDLFSIVIVSISCTSLP